MLSNYWNPIGVVPNEIQHCVTTYDDYLRHMYGVPDVE
jgi:hypothetical protein